MIKKIVSVVAVLIGAGFLFSTASDIQLGFGLVLITNGILGYPMK